MSLTKKECLEAHKELCNALVTTDYVDGRAVSTYPIYEDELGILYKLINEHFDNEPLKFEELKDGMWIWDNKHKVYNRVRETFNFGNYNVVKFAYLNETTQWGDTIEFEENRFYRKQAEDE